MAQKKTSTKPKKAESSSPLKFSEKERASMRKQAEADMKKHGLKSLKELEQFYDKKRGY